ncbi:hypothetical protein POX_a01692 [Penicillium oxalicum]|nr:hypothetical protein POX_a01692 [Penicillium oxalicum]KAI2795088.1 hypothetical protein POX_a01692 [Penicillium oxalicum]
MASPSTCLAEAHRSTVIGNLQASTIRVCRGGHWSGYDYPQ